MVAQKGEFMDKGLLESQWTQIREIINEKFTNLTEEDIRQINGRYDQLVSKLQQKYGYSKEEAEDRIRNWNFDRFAATHKTATFRDDRARGTKETDNSSLFKWLLGLGIPLLLLGLWFFNTRTTEEGRESTTTTTRETMITETAADRAFSANLRNTFLSQPNFSAAIRNVQFTTNNGVVTLSGTVPTTDIRDSLVNAVQNFAGVEQVINRIEVR